eukprot:s3584_g6.t1
MPECVKSAFAKFDRQGAGLIDRAALSRVLCEIAAPVLSQAQVEILLQQVLGDAPGPVAYLAFIDAVFALTPGDSHLEASKWFESFRTV